MASAQGIRAGAAYIELFTKDNQLVRGLNAASKRLKSFGKSVGDIGLRMAGLGASIIAPLLGTAKVFADLGSEFTDMSQRTGVSVEALSELAFAAEQSGSDVETLEGSLRKMQKTVVEAASGSEGAQDSLKRLKLTVADLAGLSPDEQFKLIADRLSEIKNPALRAATAMEIFGKSGTKLLPLMMDGAEGIEALQEQARSLGLSMSTEDAHAAEAFGDTIDVLWKVLKRAAFAIGSALAPLLTDLAQTTTRVVKTTSDWIKQNKELIVTVFKVALAIAAGGVALVVIGAAISGMGAVFGAVATIITGVGTVLATIGSALAALLSPIGLVVAGVVALGAYLLKTSGVGAQAIEWLASVFELLKNDALGAFKGISDALAAGDIGLAAKVLWLTLKMEWQKGINWLTEKWIAFKEAFMAVATEAVFGTAKIMANAWAGMQSVWTETVAAMSAAWELFSSGAVSAWKTAQNFIAKGIVHLMGLLDDSINVDETLATLDEDFGRDKQKREQDTADRLGKIETDRQQRETQIESDRSGTVAELDKDRESAHEKRKKQFDAELKGSEEELSKAQQEWRDAIDEAAQKRAEAEAGGQPGKLSQAQQDMEGVDELLNQAKNKIDVQGTFNAAAVSGLGAESLNERTAKAAEQVAANTKKLLQEAQHGGLVFA